MCDKLALVVMAVACKIESADIPEEVLGAAVDVLEHKAGRCAPNQSL